MPRSALLPVVFVPGGVTPVGPSYAPLLKEVVEEIEPLLKDLEVYTGDEPPAGYSIQLEVDALERAVNAAKLDTFHLVGYSGGGAVSLAFAAQHPDRLRSLAMFEPANVPGVWEPFERDEWTGFTAGMETMSPEEMLVSFTRRQLRPGAEPPSQPPGPPPDWMAKRPAGLRAMMRAFEADATDRDALRRCTFPVYLAYGLLTEEFMVRRVKLLAGLLPDVWIEAYPGIHHFGPPQRTQPAKYAAALRQLWARAEGRGTESATGGDSGYAA
jgi:pimeloyl-ACP methyl ester carboxylesterase